MSGSAIGMSPVSGAVGHEPRDLKLASSAQPHVGPVGAGRLRQDTSGLRQHIFDRVRAGHPVGELREDLVGRGTLSIDEPVGESSAPFSYRLERQRHHRRCEDRQAGVAPGVDDGPDPHHDPNVDGSDHRGEEEIDKGLVDDNVDLVKAVTKDGERSCTRNE